LKSFRNGVASLLRAKHKPLFRRRSGEVLVVGRNEEKMYTGTLIEDLMKCVERSERRSRQEYSQEEMVANFYTVAQSELTQLEPQLLGVA